MTCRLFEKELSSYLDGELASARAARLEAHLRTCSHCQGELSAMRDIAQRIRAVSGELKVSHDFDQRVLRAVGYYKVTGRRKQRNAITRPVVVAAVVALSLLGLLGRFLSQPLRPPARAPQAALAGAAPAAPVATPVSDQNSR